MFLDVNPCWCSRSCVAVTFSFAVTPLPDHRCCSTDRTNRQSRNLQLQLSVVTGEFRSRDDSSTFVLPERKASFQLWLIVSQPSRGFSWTFLGTTAEEDTAEVGLRRRHSGAQENILGWCLYSCSCVPTYVCSDAYVQVFSIWGLNAAGHVPVCVW